MEQLALLDLPPRVERPTPARARPVSPPVEATTAPGLDVDWSKPLPGFRSATFRRVEPENNVDRYYLLAWQEDLLGDGYVLREWGRGRPQRRLVTRFESLEEAWRLIRATARVRLRHGYSVKDVVAEARVASTQ